jgi:hypothetical protein
VSKKKFFRHENKPFDLQHIGTCNALGCPDIARYAEMIKKGDNIRNWDQEVLADAII